MATWTSRQQLWAGLNAPGYWTFTVGEVSLILRIPRRRIAFYVDEGIVESQAPTPRAGFPHKFGIVELQLFEAFRQLEQLGTAPRYLKQIAPEIRRLVEDYCGYPLPQGVERVYPPPEDEIPSAVGSDAERSAPHSIGQLILVWKDDQRGRLYARNSDYLKLAGEDYRGRLELTAFTITDLRVLLDTTYNKSREYAESPNAYSPPEDDSPAEEGGSDDHSDVE